MIEIGVRCQTYLVFTPRFALTLFLSTSDDPAFPDEADFDRIIASVRVGG